MDLPPDPLKNYNTACNTYQTGTGLWFFQDGVFSEWRARGTLLWIHGKCAHTSILSVVLALMRPFLYSRFGKDPSPVCSSRHHRLVSLKLSLAPRSFGTSIAYAPTDWH